MFNSNGFINLFHFYPLSFVLIRGKIIWIEIVNIKIFSVRFINSKTPGPFFIMANRYTRYFRFSSANNIPTGSYKMYHVTQRRNSDLSMRIICQHCMTACGATSTNDPIITSFYFLIRKFRRAFNFIIYPANFYFIQGTVYV